MDAALNILLVDDEQLILELFRDMLLDLGHRVTALASPSAALAAVREEHFDIAFLDQVLGPVRGLDLMEHLAEADPGVAFVIVTANGSAELAAEALRRGASDFISKPFFEEEIIRSIAHVRTVRGTVNGRQREETRSPAMVSDRRTDA